MKKVSCLLVNCRSKTSAVAGQIRIRLLHLLGEVEGISEFGLHKKGRLHNQGLRK